MKKVSIKKVMAVTALAVAISVSTAAVTFGFVSKLETLYQVSTLNSLLVGNYDGNITLKELKKNGSFGLGTFDKLDGEMVMLEGKVYKVTSDGKASQPDDSVTTPFAAVTFFGSDKSEKLTQGMNFEEVTKHIDSLVPSKNIVYAIKIDGTFKSVKTRSVPKQQKPYIPLTEIVKTQPTFEFSEVKGTIVGLYVPAYMAGVNAAGYHFHFINADKTAGGHVLGLELKDVTLDIDYTNGFNMELPKTEDFYKADFSGDKSADVKKVEK